MQQRKKKHHAETQNHKVEFILQENTLHIQLFPKQFLFYDIRLTDQNIPNDVLREFPNVEALFQWLKERDHYHIYEHLLHIKTVEQVSIPLQFTHNEAREKESLRKEIQEMKTKILVLQKQLAEKQHQNNYLKAQLEYLQNDLEESANLDEEQDQMKEIQKIQTKRANQIIDKALTSQDGVELKNLFSFCFNIIENRITLDSPREGGTPCFLKRDLNKSSLWRLEVKILKCSEFLSIGVCDYHEARKNSQNLGKSSKAIAFSNKNIIWCHEGIQEWKKPEGTGFKERQTVLMTVNMEKCRIDWEVDGQLQAYVISTLLEQSQRKIVPYFQFTKRQDSIEFSWR